jgi:exopolysaccharide biosynthesis WecB/TagA/CpsF family protein
MQGTAEVADDLADDLLRIVNLASPDPPNWPELLRGIGKHPTLVTFVNPLSLATARRRVAFIDELARFNLVYPDSILVAKLASLLRQVRVGRRSFDGNSLAPEVFAVCRDRLLRMALVGGRAGIAKAAGRVFANEFGASAVLTASGYFDLPGQRRDLLRTVARTAPDLVICGMGTGLQERFLLDLADEGWNGLGFTCGGYLDQAAASGARYYPDFVDALHLRAVYRMLREPARLIPRYTRDYLPFYRALIAVMGSCGSRQRVVAP